MMRIIKTNTSEKYKPMRLDRFDLNLLVILDALLEERNVTKASQRVHIGQSAASGALARLREYFGDELLVPVGRRLVLTPLAEGLVMPVRDILLRTRATIARKPGFDPASAERRFLICASDYAAIVLLANTVRRLASEAPGVVLDIRSPMHNAYEVFERGDIDLLIMPEPYMSAFPEPKIRLFDDTHVCMVWSENKLVGEALTFDQYMTLGHAAVHFGDKQSLSFEEWFLPRAGQQRKIELVVDNFSILPQVLLGTNRVATLHRRQAEHFAKHLPLRLISTPFEMPPLVEMLAWPLHLENDPAHMWLRSVIKASVADLPAATSNVSAEA
jgi:LysR family transcriptional regulator, nod-box dependent transcriptional activator